MTDVETANRLAELERRVLGLPPDVTLAARTHPTSGCHFCGLRLATHAAEDATCWFPAAPNGPAVACLECHGEAHELDLFDAAWRTDQEHRDLAVCRLLGRTDREPGLAGFVGWRWFAELPDVHPTDHRFGWVDLDELRHRADPPEHVCDESCPPLHADLLELRRGYTVPAPPRSGVREGDAEAYRYARYTGFLAKNP